MRTNTLISVIISAYNVDKYLRVCLDSLLDQSYSNFEVFLIDDGSTDSTGEICDEYARKDSRFIVKHVLNGGPSRARNLGLDLANGELISFVDGDDITYPNMFEDLLKGFEVSDNVYITNGMIHQFDDKNISKKWLMNPDKWTRTDNVLVSGEQFGIAMMSDSSNHFLWSKLFKREVFDGLRFEKFCKDEDTLITYRIAKIMKKNNWDTVEIPSVIYQYRIRENSICTGTKKPQRIDRLSNLDDIIEDAKLNMPEVEHLTKLLRVRSLYWLEADILSRKEWLQEYKDKYLIEIKAVPNSLAKESFDKKRYFLFLLTKYCLPLRKLTLQLRKQLNKLA